MAHKAFQGGIRNRFGLKLEKVIAFQSNKRGVFLNEKEKNMVFGSFDDILPGNGRVQ
jgi:hypothetical protein